MMRFYIADLHFNHGTLNDQMDNRGFESVEAMNEYMISRWNSREELQLNLYGIRQTVLQFQRKLQ